MKNIQKTSKFSTIALVLMLTISAVIVVLPTASAQMPPPAEAIPTHKQSYPYIGAIPNPVGVNQQVLLHVGITDSLQLTEHGFEGLTVTVTDPTGHEEILGPYKTDSTGGTGGIFTPTMAGTYSLVTNFPAQWYNYTGFGLMGPVSSAIYYEASTSEPLELIVQDMSIDYYPQANLPNEYWTRPIDAQLREWSRIAGNWLSTPANLYAPYNDDAPNTPHILWRQKLTTGGLVGGDLGPQAYECGDAYEGFWSSSVVLGGVVYYNKYKSGFPTQEVVAVDLHTGEELWCKPLGNNEPLAFGQNFYWSSYNYHGTFDYLWTTVGTTWNAYDPINGNLIYSMENVPSGTRVTGPRGEFYIYTVDLVNGWMTLWNSSRVISSSGSWIGGFMGGGFGTHDATLGIEWNKTIPDGLMGSVQNVLDDCIVGADIGSFFASSGDGSPIALWAIDITPGNEGDLIFDTMWTPEPGNVTYLWSGASLDDEVFVISAKETRIHYGFNLNTGALLWETEPQPYLDMWWGNVFINSGVNLAYGKLFSAGYSGILHCYDLADGDLLWTYDANDVYSEILWANSWPLVTLFFADEKVYMMHAEHSPIDPKPRGAPFFAVDVETGDLVFRVDGMQRSTVWGGRAVIGDSIIATMNTYDQQVYAIGKGPSAITVDAPFGMTKGSSTAIRGTVMDVSPGTDQDGLALRFPAGVPAIADEYMGDWMKYVYQQFDCPTTAIGVPVKLEAVDPNGEYLYIGTTTSDASGNYGYAFKPEIEGTYTIIASFEGSESYYGSHTTTYLTVDPALAVATPIDTDEPVDQPDTNEPIATPFITTELAIIAAVAVAAVIGVAAYWMLKRK
ncbi:MAG: hypothetical protein CW691_03120 [Candidatus Bathyarchaeum sp.]|nr:MAG: hypothetical protein CW691_03120 [Candidatus Bathyarchaeum sp.]